MTKNNIKLYRNPDRNKTPHFSAYTPQYQQMGIEPEQYNSPTAPSYHHKQVIPNKAPFPHSQRPRPVMRQHYADNSPSPIGRGKGLLPNVGNNLEQSWSSLDGQIVDDISGIDPNAEMIDNNEYVSTEALGLFLEGEELSNETDEHSGQTSWGPDEPIMRSPKTSLNEDEAAGHTKEANLADLLHQMEEGDYLLLINDKCICSGALEFVQEQARELVFGEHPICDGNPISIDNIVVIKRVQVKIGLFLS